MLAVWGRDDEIFWPEAVQAFTDDAPGGDIHLLDGGHIQMESELDTVAGYVRGFLGRTLK